LSEFEFWKTGYSTASLGEMMKGIYEAPESDLVEVKHDGIDGKTCPVCKNKLSRVVLHLKTLKPNNYKCPSCKAKLRFDLPAYASPVIFGLIIVYMFITLSFLDNILGYYGYQLIHLYVLFGILPMVILGFLITEFCIYKRKIVLKLAT